MRAIIENMILPNFVLCYIPWVLGIVREKFIFFNFLDIFNISKILENPGEILREKIEKL